MEPLDLKKFLWESRGKTHIILAITDFQDHDVVVYRELKDIGSIKIATVDQFCREFHATYEVDS